MKKLLLILSTTLLIVSTPTVGLLFNNTTSVKNNNKILNSFATIIPVHLLRPLEWLAPVDNNFCLPCSIAMILNYYHVRDIDQHDIENYINRRPSNVAPYLNTRLGNLIPNNNRYYRTVIPNNFGRTNVEQRLLQQYVTQSIGQNIPVILDYFLSRTGMGHAVVITGVDIDTENPNNTRYLINDSSNSRNRIILGRDMRNLLRFGGDLIGAPNNFDLNKREVNIKDITVDKNKLYSYDNYQVAEINIDLTALGIDSIKDLKTSYDNIELPNFKGNVYLFSYTILINNFKISTRDFPENNYDWHSGNYEISNKREDWGAAHIEGRILSQISFTHLNNHLMLALILLVGGTSWATQTNAHVWFDTGNLLSFSKD